MVVFNHFLVLLTLQVLGIILSHALLLMRLVYLMAINRLEATFGLASHAQLRRAALDILIIARVLLVLIFSA